MSPASCTSLLETIDCLHQLECIAWFPLAKAQLLIPLEVVHVDIMLHVSIEEGTAYVHRDTFQVLKCHQCKDCPQSCPLGCRTEGLVKVQPRPLREALANQPAFVSLYGAIWPALQ